MPTPTWKFMRRETRRHTVHRSAQQTLGVLGTPLEVGWLATGRQLCDGLERATNRDAHFDRTITVVRDFAMIYDEHRAGRSAACVGLLSHPLHSARQPAGHVVDVHVALFGQYQLLWHISVFDLEHIASAYAPFLT